MMIKQMTLQKLFSALIFLLINIRLSVELDESRQSVSAFLVEKPLEPSEQEVHAAEQDVADFFWTGSGDGSGPKHAQTTGTKFPNTIVRTATILATVFIDGNFDDFDPLCVVDCDKKIDENGVVESIDKIPPEDRRYWLLTVVAGLFSKGDFPILEAKLAKLYRIAFLRQQAKHLGIANGRNNTTNSTTTLNQTIAEEHVARKKRFISEGSNILPTKTLNDSEKIRTRRFEINKHVYERQVLRMKRHRVPTNTEIYSSTTSPINLKLPQPYEIIFRSDDKSKNKKLKAGKNLLQEVNVIIHDALHLEDERGVHNTLDVDPSVEKNQTEIIYTVIVGGKPILATTAAEDMQLVTNDEVVKIMENDVVLKAEPYLKEPLATPLVPQHMNDSTVTVTTYFNQNPLLIALMTIAIILFILLLITLTLYGRSKRRLAVESKRQSASQALVQKINVDDDINTIRSNSMEDIGIENLAFEKERDNKASVTLQKKDPPVLNFPLPPPNRPSSGSSTTSDSSVYYPKRRYKFNSIQDLLDEHDGKAEEIYSKVKSSSSKIANKKDQSKIHKNRQRRKYRADNRVGSLEHINSNAFQSDADVGYNDESLMHNEAFNPHVSQYNANKLMADKTFTVVESEQKKNVKSKGRKLGGAEAINQELLIQHGNRVASADTNSIGSFLSMNSIRSFPKCSVPEPLSRVLEPVSVTHLDHSDADYDTLKNYRMIDSQKSLDLDDIDDETERDAQCTQSDGADPGFVGPIVWEMHKKGLDISTNSLGSPMRDPHATRNRFEGLLEGAMKLYGSSSYSNCHSLMNQQEDDQLGQMPGVIKSKEARGRSAATIRLTSRTSGLLSRTDFHPTRPKTADQPDLPLQNPMPSIHAWVGNGSGSLVRPLSAGIYHKPESTSHDEKHKIDRSRTMSASPIIDAIQEELKRISNVK